MKNMKNLTYNEYTGSIEFSKNDNLLYGQVIGIKSLISYEGKTGDELEKDFICAIDSYLSDCKENNEEPEKPFKGSFNVRVSPALHQASALLAKDEKTTLNALVADSLKNTVFDKTGQRF